MTLSGSRLGPFADLQTSVSPLAIPPENVGPCPPSARATARIAHCAGNDRATLQAAIAARVDWIEIDLWYACGRLVARHERGLGRLPLLYDKWHLRLVREPLLDLDELIDRTVGGPQLFIDLKGTNRRLPEAIVKTLRAHDALDRAAVCGQYWPPLDAIAQEEPRIRVFHSLGRPEHVPAHLARLARDTVSAGVSAGHWLLTPALVRELRAAGRQVFAWTVNDPAQAARLVAWGVDGVISDRLDLLNALP